MARGRWLLLLDSPCHVPNSKRSMARCAHEMLQSLILQTSWLCLFFSPNQWELSRLGSTSTWLLQQHGSTNAKSLNRSYLFGLCEEGLVLGNYFKKKIECFAYNHGSSDTAVWIAYTNNVEWWGPTWHLFQQVGTGIEEPFPLLSGSCDLKRCSRKQR